MKVRVEYDPTPIRHIAVQCPKCGKWFMGYDITDDELSYDYQIQFAKFSCPVCNHDFSGCTYGGENEEIEIEEVGSADECYNGCLEKRLLGNKITILSNE